MRVKKGAGVNLEIFNILQRGDLPVEVLLFLPEQMRQRRVFDALHGDRQPDRGIEGRAALERAGGVVADDEEIAPLARETGAWMRAALDEKS